MKNKKNLYLTLFSVTTILISLLFVFFYKSSKLPGNGNNTIVVGTNADFPPFEYIENGTITGFDIDLVNAIADQMGKKVNIKNMSFDSLLIEIQSGKIDIIAAALTPTEERSKQILFTKPYIINDPLVVITLSKFKPVSITDLKNKEIIVNDGYTAETFMSKQNNIILKRLATPAEAFLALQTGQAYAYVSSKSAVQPFFEKYGSDKFNILKLDVSDNYALAVSKIRPQLFKEIQEILNRLEENKTLENLRKKWNLNYAY